ncbi:MAG TPA: hypothetical protein DD738_06840 [Ruminiclostridium sp.]|nr:hypothetical protein [Ruminiclostridium sp.]
MSLKNNIRSFRYSDEVAGILEGFTGNSLNEKFENIILYCFWERKKIDKQIAQRRKELDRLHEECREVRERLYEYETFEADKNRLSAALTKVALDVIDYEEKLKASMERDIVTQTDLPDLASMPVECVTKVG